MKFISAGHCNIMGPNYDPGAIGINNRSEANETVRVRNAVIKALNEKGYKDIIQDIDSENRHQYFSRIKTGSGSVVVEFHFNAGPASATGTESIIEVDGDRLDKAMAAEFCNITSSVLNIKNRGVKTEADTRHKRLGLMKETGIVCLVEICFITNANDMINYDKFFHSLAREYAAIIIKYDNILT